LSAKHLGRQNSGELRRHFRDKTWPVHVPRRGKDLYMAVGAVVDELTAPPSLAFTSRQTVDGDRPRSWAIVRNDRPAAKPRETSPRPSQHNRASIEERFRSW
jgi:hypothetical protein